MRRTNKEWTKDDESRLQQLVEKRASAFRAGIALKRSTTAVQTKARAWPFSADAQRRKRLGIMLACIQSGS
jgi:hypothetical protein